MGVNTHPDLPGRKPIYGDIGEDISQFPRKKKNAEDNLQQELNQGSGRKYKEGVPKLGRVIGNR